MTSGIISIFVWSHFNSAWCALVSFAAGTFVDIDHLIDYYASHPYTLSIKKIYMTCLDMNLKKIYLILHSYEFITLLWLAIYIFTLSNTWKAMAIGFTQHLIFDQIVNPVTPLTYFLTYRIVKGFNKKALLKEIK